MENDSNDKETYHISNDENQHTASQQNSHAEESTTVKQTFPLPSSKIAQGRQKTTNVRPTDVKVQAEDHDQQSSNYSNSRKRNAFSELMAPKPKQQKMALPPKTELKPSPARPTFASGLLNYITQPDTFPPGTIIRQTEHTTLIRDLYPKSLVHLLLMPRDPHFYTLNPFEAFQPTSPTHAAFLTLMRDEARSAALLAASELSRLVSPTSQSCQARNNALTSDGPPITLPQGRDFLPDIKIGVHAVPSMDTLHIHIISVDNHSPCLKTKKHYNSFNTDFFIDLADFPLMEGKVNLTKGGQEASIKGDMKCWRCGRSFGNKFKQLKEHLEEEYEQWRVV